MTQGEVHIFQGMSRDTHQIRQDSKFLWDAHNIRLTNREDSTSLAITNERGTLNTEVTFKGYYVGHCVLGKYLIVFTSNDDSSETHIYRVERTEEGFRSVILFLEGNSWKEAWVPTHPIETIGIYETNYVQKVYWVDGLNQPRVINIAKPEYILTGTKYEVLLSLSNVNFSEQGLTLGNPGIINPDTGSPYTDAEWNSFKQDYDTEIGPIYTKESFDFCRKLQLRELVSVYRGEGNGMFSPGTIQYALSYFNKYEQETNIFYTTTLNYISPIERGGSPEEKVSNFFTIDIKELDPNFDYLRIYSIHRTSIDATPEVKLVEDVLIKDISSIQFVDDGTKGTIIDPTQLLYIGGTELIAGCIAHKDGTLFLGNLQLKPDNIFEDIILEDWAFSEPYFIPSIDTVNTDSTYYNYTSSLGNKYSAGFQSGEIYRCGIQVQTKDGKWSTPIFLGDTVLNNSIIATERVKETLAIELTEDTCKALYNAGGRKVRTCIVFPRPYERHIICQGILCPTVYSASGRHSGSIYAMSSWFFRPAVGKANDPKSIYQGALIQYRHNKPLFSAAHRGAEIQNMFDSTIDNVSSIDSASYDKYKSYYFVDENIITFHSPDIEFDTNLQNLDWSNTKLQIVGKANLGAISGDISISTSTPAAGVKTVSGFNHVPIGYQTNNLIKVNGGLVSGLFYDSALIKDDYEVADNKGFMIYPWHRSGSLNNDTNRPTDKGTKSAVLSTKIISNLKFFPDNSTLPVLEGDTEHGGTIFNYDISTPKLFNADELILTKLSPSYLTKDVPYMGNMDTLSTSSESYPFYVGKESEKFDTDIVKLESDSNTTYIDSSSDPVRIKYKSSPHLVFSLLDSSGKIRVLPRHASITDNLPDYTVPEWQDSGTGERKDGYDGIIYGIGTKSVGAIGWLGVGGNEGQYILDFPEKSLMSGCYQIYKNVEGFADLKSVEEPEGLILKVLKGHTFLPYDDDTLQAIFPGMDVKNVRDRVYEGSSLYYKVVKDEQSTTTKTYYRLEQATLSTTSTSTFTIDQDTFGSITESTAPYLLIAKLIREVPADVKFGGTSKEALQQNLWIPASDPVVIPPSSDTVLSIPYEYGDTWYQRYDCLKTYPFTKEDENQIVEIGSFMCETRVNIDGRYDKNRGQYSNLSMTPQNFNLLNEVYTQKNNFFNYRILDEDYYKQHKYPNQITWSKEKHAGEDVDTWANITLANTLDMNGELGEVTSIKAWNEFLICFQEDAVNQILFNSRAQIPTTDGVPIEISNGYKVDGSRALSTKVGCSNKWSIATSPMGIYFIDSNTDSLYLFNGQLANLSGSKKMDWWFKEPYADKVWSPMQKNNNGVRTFYDRVWEDIYFVPGNSNPQPDALCYSEKLGQFTSLMSYGGTQAMFNYMDEFYSLRGDSNGTKVTLYQNFAGSYNNIFDKIVGWDFSFIANDNPVYTKVFDTTEMRADIFSSDGMLLNTCPITDIEVSNEYQQGSATINSTNMRKKFRIWRGLLPRNKNTRQRIRNPWTQITLKWDPSKQEDKNTRAIVHDISVKYTI